METSCCNTWLMGKGGRKNQNSQNETNKQRNMMSYIKEDMLYVVNRMQR